MKLETSEKYEDLATEWQYQLILLLKQVLEKKGIATDMAKDIVGEFVFDLSMLHDQGEIKVEGKTYNPKLAFDNFNGALIASDDESNLHEYAFGSTSEAFGE